MIGESRVGELLAWVAETMPERVRVVGCFAWEVFDFRIDREFQGVVVYFDGPADAVHFRLAWADDYRPEQEPDLDWVPEELVAALAA